MQYMIITDSACDISQETLFSWNVECVDLTFRKKDGNDIYTNRDIEIDDFYQEMKDGTIFQTSAVNTSQYVLAFETILKKGLDIVYICFSSGLSSSINSAILAKEELERKYPDRKIAIIDSLCASAGEGLLVYLATKMRDQGTNFDSLVHYIETIAPNISHWFTVDDLVYLKRGGRISAAAAFAATVLDIKPVMHVDDDGHLVGVSKVRGRKVALSAMVDKYNELAEDTNGVYFISHGDCLSDAILLENMIKEKCNNSATVITDVGPVIGSHSGPGTLALFFVAKER